MDSHLFLNEIVDGLKQVSGVQAIVLGGSRARGTHSQTSDYDLGLYYEPTLPLDIPALGLVAAQLDDEHRPGLVTEIGGWGPWINGGGWLKIQSQAVDFIYRDLGKVRAVIADCRAGQVSMDYQPGHPFGFLSAIYLAEAAVCQPLWDPSGVVARLKEQASPYPDALQSALIVKSAWEVDFSIQIAKKSIARADAVYAAGCCFRALMCITQVLFALNHVYWLNEKGALQMTDHFATRPEAFASRAGQVIDLLEANPAAITRAIALLQEINADMDQLVQYRGAGFRVD